MNFRHMKIVVDCAHGATYHITPNVLEELGANVICLGVDPNGVNINDGVGSLHLDGLVAAVRDSGADIGIALDGDGDRVLMVDDRGVPVDGDEILYVIARSRLETGTLRGRVVGTQMSNLGLEVALREHGVEFERTKVGDRYILARLLHEQWNLGGEPSGHIICLDRTSTGDGTISALQVLAEMYKKGKSLRELLKGMHLFPQTLINVDLGDVQAAQVMEAPEVRRVVTDVANRLGDEGRVLLRPSGTEALVRVMVEGRDAKSVNTFAQGIAGAVKRCVAT
jgi:phosphoglucosamine mutase